jgi:hypothetical protein
MPFDAGGGLNMGHRPKGRPSPEAESYLEVLEGNLRTFERHRAVILGFIKKRPPQIKLIAQPDVSKLPAR